MDDEPRRFRLFVSERLGDMYQEIAELVMDLPGEEGVEVLDAILVVQKRLEAPPLLPK